MYAETERLKGLEGHPASSHNSFHMQTHERSIDLWGFGARAERAQISSVLF